MQSTSMTNTDEARGSMLPPATGSTNINVGPGERVISAFLGAMGTSYGLRHLGSLGGLTMLISGGFLLSRGLTGYCSINSLIGRNSNQKIRKTSAMELRGTFTINKPRSEVYNFWRKLENLPLFMKHLENVTEEDSVNSTWKARIPGGLGTVTWKATITEDRPQELLTWASQPGSMIDTAGEVRFEEAIGDRGTDIQICMTYRLPGGDVGSIAGKLFNPAVEKMMKEDLKRFRTIMETGEFELPDSNPTSHSSGQQPDTGRSKRTRIRKSPDASLGATSSPDSTLQGSPVNEINQTTEKHLSDNSFEEDRWDKNR